MTQPEALAFDVYGTLVGVIVLMLWLYYSAFAVLIGALVNAEGEREANWVLMDYLDCILHVFVPDERDYYRLETLWGEAPRLELDLAGAAPRAATGGG